MKVRISPFNPETHFADERERVRISKDKISYLHDLPKRYHYSWLSRTDLRFDNSYVIELEENRIMNMS